jgi:hypothetical protein
MRDTSIMSDDVTSSDSHKLRTPSGLALNIIENLLLETIKDRQHVGPAEVDLRAARDIRQRLEQNPRDAQSIQWLRQLAQTWSPRLRQHALKVRRVYDYLAVADKA